MCAALMTPYYQTSLARRLAQGRLAVEQQSASTQAAFVALTLLRFFDDALAKRVPYLLTLVIRIETNSAFRAGSMPHQRQRPRRLACPMKAYATAGSEFSHDKCDCAREKLAHAMWARFVA